MQEDVADEKLDENETYGSLKNAMNDNISTIFTEAPYSDEMTEDTYFYHYKMKKEHERPYSTSGKVEFILNVYTTKNGSSSYATQNDDGEFDKLKGIGEVKISVPAIE